jgi:hypothetical protein
MGLDMYLTAHIPLWKASDNELPIKIRIDGDEFEINRSDIIRKEVAYWRKANAIHQWFVNECGGGIDECQEMFVTKEKLKELLELCERILENKNKAKDLLPTQSGFFFGSLDYDEGYFQDIEYTKNVLIDIINNPHIPYVYYQASW